MGKSDDIWPKAAAVGSLWASVEIIVGSFLHNLHLPFAGSMLAAVVLVFLVAVQELWTDRGLIWRAGLICAAMKSLSPGAIIFGPMVAIVAEALLFELGLKLSGRNLLGYILGSAMAMAWLPLQKIGRMLLFYGSDMIEISIAAFTRLQQFVGISALSPAEALGAVVLFYPLLGMLAALCGWYLGQRAKALPPLNPDIETTRTPAPVKQEATRNLALIPLHLLAVITGMIVLNSCPFEYGLAYVAIYVTLSLGHYPTLYRRFCKPGFWIFFICITLMAGVFLGSLGQGGSAFNLSLKAEYLLIGVQMNLRAALLLSAFSAIGVELRHPRITSFMHLRGCGAYSRALQSAFGVMPQMLESMMRQGMKLQNPLRSLAFMLQQLEFWRVHFESIAAPPVFILTGGRGSGKTSILQMLSAEISQQNLKVSGIVSRGLWKEERRSGFDVVDLATQKQIPLCRRDVPATGIQKGPYHFYPAGIKAGQVALEMAVAANPAVIIVDEVGPLELRGDGWAEPLGNVLSNRSCPIVISVRPSLVEAVSEHWCFSPTVVWDVEHIAMEQMLMDLNIHGSGRCWHEWSQAKSRASV